MTNRERALGVLRYEDVDRVPLVHFGFWRETLEKWAGEGHLSDAQATEWADGNAMDDQVTAELGFDMNWQSVFQPATSLFPHFESKVIEEFPDGSKHILNGDGMIMVQKPGAGSIPAEIDHMLKDRAAWEEHYKWRLEWNEDRVTGALVRTPAGKVPFGDGGLDFLKSNERDTLYGLHCGSLYGTVRNMLGVEGSAYLSVDDEALYTEIIDTIGDICYRCTEFTLRAGARFDFAHFWEDICFKNGPLVAPSVFEEKVGPHYKRITDLVRSYGLDVVSLDCDGKIDALIPTWFHNGVNTMFPIEVGTWGASIAPWRETYGRGLLGVGGMNKTIFSRDRAAVEAEVARIVELVKLGGYLPCPDHRIAPDARWDLVRYYTDALRDALS